MLNYRILKRNINIWSVISIIVVILIIVPSLNIMMNVFDKPNDVWFHIKENLLSNYIKNTIILIIFTGIFSIIIGVSLAWIISLFDFPLRKVLNWALILPLAIPPYIGAYTYSGLLSYTGYPQVILRNTFSITLNQKYFDIMSMQGTIFIFTIFMYPYIYIIVKSYLQKQSASLIETSRVLGKSYLSTFFYVGLPILRNSIIGGVIIVLLEVLNDYGVVSYFNVKTFSTAIFTAWFSFGDITSAVRLSAILMIIVISILVIEKLSRGRKRFSSTNTKLRPIKRIKLKGYKKVIAIIFSLTILSLGFLIPFIQLMSWSFLTYKKVLNINFWYLSINTIINALLVTIIIVLIALIIANYNRLYSNLLSKMTSRITTIGYSIPGAVVAIAVIMCFIMVDNNLYNLYKFINPNTNKLVLTSSIYMLLFAYVIRFMGIGYNSVESGFERVGSSFLDASRTLGMSRFKSFIKIDIPMIKPAIISASILVFIDVLKELPLTLILRPFNYDTLATKTYQYANDEMIHEASIPSIIIIIISMLAILILNKSAKKGGDKVVRKSI